MWSHRLTQRVAFVVPLTSNEWLSSYTYLSLKLRRDCLHWGRVTWLTSNTMDGLLKLAVRKWSWEAMEQGKCEQMHEDRASNSSRQQQGRRLGRVKEESYIIATPWTSVWFRMCWPNVFNAELKFMTDAAASVDSVNPPHRNSSSSAALYQSINENHTTLQAQNTDSRLCRFFHDHRYTSTPDIRPVGAWIIILMLRQNQSAFTACCCQYGQQTWAATLPTRKCRSQPVT